MKSYGWKLGVCLVAATLVACGPKDDNNGDTNNGDTNNGTTNNGTTNNGTTNNGTTNNDTNNGTTNNGTTNNGQVEADVNEQEPNGFDDTPTPFTLGDSIGGVIATGAGETSDFDIFSVELTAGTVVEFGIEASGSGLGDNAVVFLADANFEFMERYLDGASGLSSRQAYIPIDGTYIVGVYDARVDTEEQHGGDDSWYVVTTSTAEVTPQALELPGNVTGDANDGGIDIYSVTSAADVTAIAETIGDREPISGELDTVLFVIDTATGEIVGFNDDVGGDSYDSRAVFPAAAGGAYEIVVDYWFATTAGPYSLTLSETDDDISSPTPLVADTPATGDIEARDGAEFDTDYFLATLQPGDTLSFTAVGAGGLQPAVTVAVDSFFGILPIAIGYPVGDTSSVVLAHPSDATEPGDYYVFIDDVRNIEDPENPADIGGAGFSYTLTSTATTRTAAPVTLPYSIPGSISAVGGEVFYEFTIPAGHMFAANVSTVATDFEPVIATLSDNGTSYAQDAPAVLFPATATTIKMGVRDAYFRGGATYLFTPDFYSVDVSGITFAAATETEPNDTAAAAQALTVPAAVAGVLDGVGTGDLKPDWYKVSAVVGQRIGAWTLAGADGATDDADTVIRIIAPDGTTVVAQNDDYEGQESSFFSALLVTADQIGDYYVVVEPYCVDAADCTGNGDYTLNAFVQ